MPNHAARFALKIVRGRRDAAESAPGMIGHEPSGGVQLAPRRRSRFVQQFFKPLKVPPGPECLRRGARCDCVSGRSTADKLYLLIESVKPDNKHAGDSTASIPAGRRGRGYSWLITSDREIRPLLLPRQPGRRTTACDLRLGSEWYPVPSDAFGIEDEGQRRLTGAGFAPPRGACNCERDSPGPPTAPILLSGQRLIRAVMVSAMSSRALPFPGKDRPDFMEQRVCLRPSLWGDAH